MEMYALKLWGHRPGEHTPFFLSGRFRVLRHGRHRGTCNWRCWRQVQVRTGDVQGWGSPALVSRSSAYHPKPMAHILSKKKERPLRTLNRTSVR